MTAVISLALNIVAFALIAFIAIMFYFAYEEYRGGKDFCITKDTIEKTSGVFDKVYGIGSWAKKLNPSKKEI